MSIEQRQDLGRSPAVDPTTRAGREGAVWISDLPDGREVCVYSMMFGNGRLCVGDPESMVMDDFWCFDSVPLAVAAAQTWNGTGDPEGWKRHPKTSRRRPDGDPDREYVAD